MSNLAELSASEAARRIRAGSLSPVDLLAACLERVDKLEPAVQAWVTLDRDAAMGVARARAEQARAGRFVGALHGVPVALKDIFDAAGLPTRAGVTFYDRRPDADATSVARLRAAGAVVMGKVVTTSFALMDPGPTRNPWNPEHTPGGSSSGSAAAVGARMAPLALGSQTVGSVLRPAAYCGVVGFKPTHGRIPTTGVVALAWSLDHVGIFARAVEDVGLALGLLAGPDGQDALASAAPVEDYAVGRGPLVAPRIGVLRALLERAAPETTGHVDGVARALGRAGAALVDVALPPSFEGLHDLGQRVVRVECASFHRELFDRHRDAYPPRLREAIELGRGISAVDFLEAQAARRRFRADMAAVAARFDALLTPTAPGPAPRGIGATGDPWFCAPWSFAGMPSISLPSGLDGQRLPLAIQLVGAPFAEARLLGAAAWCERAIGFAEAPPGA
jgi:Asp-tRNA(Asn)/Glu-tRNA(Gln) amidotransferase A subunit family amidase